MAWTLAAKSPTVKPCGAGTRASTADKAWRIRCLFRSTPPTRVAPSGWRWPGDRARRRRGTGVHTVQRSGEPFGDPGQLGDDLGELLDHPPAPAVSTSRATTAAARLSG